MKKQYIIEIETSNMAPVYNTNVESNQSKEVEQIGFFEEQILTGIKLWIKENLRDEFLNQAILDQIIPDFEFQGVEGWTDLSQYGTIKVTLIDDGDKEVVSFFQREKIPVDEELEEDEEEQIESPTEETEEESEEDEEELY